MTNNRMPICYIAGSGGGFPRSVFPFVREAGDFVIAADGGYALLSRAGIEPDLLIGDFDSLDESLLKTYNGESVRLPKEKDVTDMFAACQTGLNKGYKIFFIFGGSGGSFRHSFANIQTLSLLAENGAKGYLFCDSEVMTVIKNNSVQFPPLQKGLLSVFAIGGEARGITLNNLKFPLENYTMSGNIPIGVSNEFIGKAATVSVENGSLLLIYEL